MSKSVIHGDWVMDYKDIKCSICKKIAYSWNCNGTYIQVESNYCPHCGAKMRTILDSKLDIENITII